jgi:hypothetical protein
MKNKSLSCAAFLLLFTFASAWAKSYDFEIQTARKAGNTQLKPGRYSLVIKGDQATLKDEMGKSYTLPIKVESGEEKFRDTIVDTVGGEIRFIQLGGTKTRLAFVE